MSKADDRKFFRELPRRRLYPERVLVTAAELAERLGVHVETVYRNRLRLELEDGLPAPLTRRGPLKWDRLSIDAWFTRSRAPIAPPSPARTDDDDEVRRVEEHYRNGR